MKKIMMALVTVFVLAGSYQAKSQINTGISFNTFYVQLSPYGRWVDNADYGQVWIANANGFEPYSNNGHWVFTNYGWTWVSDYAWGWAPFHYGRWAYIQSYGWAWIPGYEWAPAWVSWCQYDGYYGWAPMGPGMGFNMGFGGIPYNHWRFVRHRYINSPNVYQHYQRPAIKSSAYNQVTIINNTQVNNNVTYATGPAQQEVERVTRKKIQPKEVNFTEETAPATPVTGNTVRIYRPALKGNTVTIPAEGTVKQPVKPVATEQAAPAVNNTEPVKPIRVPAPVKQPVDKEPQAIKEVEQPAPVRDRELQPIKNRENEAVRQDAIKKQEAIKTQQQYEEQQEDIKRQREESIRQQQLKEQQAAEQQRRQDELRRQREQQAEIRRQQQEQIRQEKMQQQQIKKEEKEQKIVPREQPAASKPLQPVKPTKKG
ncbi:MAG: hypothetical protein IPP72_14460 [Chitinophagaceae bacterium]|nr:hypothetical protein [Chitinophagaceae bacterium]